MRRFLISGGVNKKTSSDKGAWAFYLGGKVLDVNINGKGSVLIEDLSVPGYIEAGKKIGTVFKAGSKSGGEYVLCTTTEVSKYDPCSGEKIKTVSHPKFNDVHHAVELKDESLLVVSTGLDCLINIDWSGFVIRYWALDPSREYMFNDSIDYRSIESTKPHSHHPNFVFLIDDDIYVTRFKDKDAVCLTSPQKKSFNIPYGNVHDGIVSGENVWFTTTNGWICAFDRKSKEEVYSLDLNTIYPGETPLGWCRGLSLLGDGKVFVGFSRLRKTKLTENIQWAAGKVMKSKRRPYPTRLALIDLNNRRLISEIDLEAGFSMNAIFSIVEI